MNEKIMGMTIWIHTLVDREYKSESDDHSLMFRYSESIDDLCDSLNVKKISEFFDYTDQEISYDSFDEFSNDLDSETDDQKLDPETGLAYGIDDMTWFESSSGITTLSAIREAIKNNGMPGIDVNDIDFLLEEIDDCLSHLIEVSNRNGKFHLAVIE